jgi:hypothetical protein
MVFDNIHRWLYRNLNTWFNLSLFTICHVRIFLLHQAKGFVVFAVFGSYGQNNHN